jgi:hypothetical protein
MVNRLEFFDSISGIQYPRMIVDFFDHFLALKQLVEDTGKISVYDSANGSIIFSIIFATPDIKNQAILNIQPGVVNIYNRPINVSFRNISDTELIIELR